MDKPPPQEEETALTGKSATTFGVGLLLYAMGFALLAKNHSDAAPVFIVAGILAMVFALL